MTAPTLTVSGGTHLSRRSSPCDLGTLGRSTHLSSRCRMRQTITLHSRKEAVEPRRSGSNPPRPMRKETNCGGAEVAAAPNILSRPSLCSRHCTSYVEQTWQLRQTVPSAAMELRCSRLCIRRFEYSACWNIMVNRLRHSRS